jgi:hypothetical protein
LGEQKNLEHFFGMTADRDFDSDVDTISGSTMSTNMLFGQLKTILLTFDSYISVD